MSRLALFLLGAPRIEFDGVPIEVDTRKATALLAYVAVTDERHSRDSLAALFWPEADQARAHAALRRTLSALNKALAGDWLDIDRETVGLDREAGVWLDVDEFHDRLAERRTHGHPTTETCPACLKPLTNAVALYRGDFLAGFTLRDSPGFDDWQFFQAESLRRELADALERLVRGYSARGEFEPAIAYARRWLAVDPLHEPAHRHLMQLYAWAGERNAALRQYRTGVRVLEQELGVPPLEETAQLYQAIKENRGPPPPVEAHQQLSLTERFSRESSAPEAHIRQSDYPLVGRSQEWATLRRAYEEPVANGHILVLEGEAGIGKTRLAEEFLAYARANGAATIAARCYEGETNLAYGPFIEALRVAIGQPHGAARLEGISAHWLGEAARLLPELAALYPGLPPAPPLEGPGAQSRFFEGLRHVLMAVCRGLYPGILFFDDLHWADAASLDLLTYLVPRLREQPLFVLVTWRGEGVPRDHRLRHLVSEAQRGGTGMILTLSRLSLPHVTELVRSATASGVALPEGLSERLYHETEGVPFFVVEYLATMGAAEDWSMPGSVRDLLHSRLSAVTETGRQLLQTAAVIGRSCDLDTLREASGRSDEETAMALESLIAQGLIHEVAGSEAPETPVYDFSHEKLRALIYDETSLARRRLLHQRAAKALVTRARIPHQTGRLAGQIAHHYRLAGQEAEAADYFLLAGEHARAVYANAEALAHFRAALALGHPDTAKLHEAIGDLQTLLGEYRAALTSLETAAALCGPDTPDLARLEHQLGNVYHRRGEWALAESHFQAAVDILSAPGNLGEKARLYADWSLTAHRRGQTDRALELAHRALELAKAADDQRALARHTTSWAFLPGINWTLIEPATIWDKVCQSRKGWPTLARESRRSIIWRLCTPTVDKSSGR